ncbi:MAG: FAD-dependent oxidoreductase, partial [Streptococcus sp.]|nr:FAD-dependent oxidoreductase [Streptococcus sp.]
VIIGGGIISVELAFAMAPLGVDVTVIEVAPTILATEDDEARSIIREKMEQLGITILEGVSIDRVKENAVILADGKSYSYDNLLVATGRKPNIELAQMMGLELTEKGFIKVDSYYESSQSGVYAIGDLIPGYMLAHVASSEGIKAVRAICRQAEEPVDNSSVPRSLFTTPEIASFGLSEEEAVQQGYDISVGQLPYVYNGRAIVSNSEKGFVKIVSEKRYHLLLGAVIVGPHATDILQSLIVLKDAEGTLDQLDKTIFAHPTISELVQEVARLILRS